MTKVEKTFIIIAGKPEYRKKGMDRELVYTSYYAMLGELRKKGIIPIAISRGVPDGFDGLRIPSLAPTWAMLKMSDEDYDKNYEKLLQRNDRCGIIKSFEGKNVALLCWERDINKCHRKRVAEWLREGGCEVEEFSKDSVVPVVSSTDRAEAF